MYRKYRYIKRKFFDGSGCHGNMVEKCCKCWVHVCIVRTEKVSTLHSRNWRERGIFFRAYNTYKKFTRLNFPHLKHSATKLCNVTNFRMYTFKLLCDFVFSNWTKIQSMKLSLAVMHIAFFAGFFEAPRMCICMPRHVNMHLLPCVKIHA